MAVFWVVKPCNLVEVYQRLTNLHTKDFSNVKYTQKFLGSMYSDLKSFIAILLVRFRGNCHWRPFTKVC
jgi:hypothetical protein